MREAFGRQCGGVIAVQGEAAEYAAYLERRGQPGVRSRFDLALSALLRESEALQPHLGRILAGDSQAGAFHMTDEERGAIKAEMSTPEGVARMIAAILAAELREADERAK